MKQEKLQRILQGSGLKATRQRLDVLGELERADKPVSAEELYLHLRGAGGGINLSTVYRVLDALSACGIAHAVRPVGSDKALFELVGDEHRHYLVCTSCRRMQAVGHCPLESFEELVARENGFVVTGHRLDIYGICPDCRQKDSQGV